MGSGIAQVIASANCHVTLVDVSATALQKGTAIITESLQRIAKKKSQDPSIQAKYINDVMTNINTSTDPKVAVSNADLVIEAIVENIDVKRKLFASLHEHAPKDAIFCSNTSSLPISRIAEACPERKKNFAGLHFFNPVPQMKLVEVIRTNDTDKQVTETLVEFCKKLGKSPVLCKDTPGYFYFILTLDLSLIVY
jgi:3-hydroxyacyl-CoA dehydrogenase